MTTRDSGHLTISPSVSCLLNGYMTGLIRDKESWGSFSILVLSLEKTCTQTESMHVRGSLKTSQLHGVLRLLSKKYNGCRSKSDQFDVDGFFHRLKLIEVMKRR